MSFKVHFTKDFTPPIQISLLEDRALDLHVDGSLNDVSYMGKTSYKIDDETKKRLEKLYAEIRDILVIEDEEDDHEGLW